MDAIVRRELTTGQEERIEPDVNGDYPIDLQYTLADVVEDHAAVVLINHDGTTVTLTPDWNES